MKTAQERMEYVVQLGIEKAREEFHQMVLERRRQEALAANEQKRKEEKSSSPQTHVS